MNRPSASATMLTLSLAWTGCVAESADDLPGVGDEIDPPPLMEQGGGYDQHPQYLTNWTSDGWAPVFCPNGYIADRMYCRGRYCDDIQLGCRQVADIWGRESPGAIYYYETTGWFSEEGQNWQTCSEHTFLRGIECSGDYCDNIRLHCVNYQWLLHYASDEQWSSTWFSEENGGNDFSGFDKWIVGLRCQGRYCDNMNLLTAPARRVPGH